MPFRYPPSRYDDYFCLKPPFLLWVAWLYLSRAITLPLLLALAPIAAIGSDTRTLLAGLFDVHTLAPSVIAATVLFAFLRRVPSAGDWVRWIWAHGRILLAISATLDLILSLLYSSLLRGGLLDDKSVLAVLAAAVDAYFLVYVLAARQVRDAFAEFPAPAEVPADVP